MARESVGRTFLVAFSVCVVFSVLVSTAAVTLRPIQEINKLLDKKKNIHLGRNITLMVFKDLVVGTSKTH